MNNRIAVIVVAVIFFVLSSHPAKVPVPVPAPPLIPVPRQPQPGPKPPSPRPCPLLQCPPCEDDACPVTPNEIFNINDVHMGGKTSPDGTEIITIDLPQTEKKSNSVGNDGLGLCVFTSIEWAARWANVIDLFAFQQQMEHEPGGGYPEKVDEMLKKYAPNVQYLQSTTGDIEFLKSVLKTGRLPAVTYSGHDPQYGDQQIAHMVTLVHLSDKWACISDNNATGDSQFKWMTPEAFKKRYVEVGGGWTVVLLHVGPPPVPSNQ